jgi:hypothetical protein
MNWKTPSTNMFWVPVPYAGEKLTDITAHLRDENKKPQTFELTNPETGENTACFIIDYLGPYPIQNPPDFLARCCTDKTGMTGKMLFKLLTQKVPEFRHTDKILFYQLAKKL